jgi:hypothetical protein
MGTKKIHDDLPLTPASSGFVSLIIPHPKALPYTNKSSLIPHIAIKTSCNILIKNVKISIHYFMNVCFTGNLTLIHIFCL